MRRHFAAIGDKKHFGTGWPICWNTGNDVQDNQDYSIEILGHKADEIPSVLATAKPTAELIAGLLNAYFNGIDVSKLDEKKVCRMGKPLVELNIPHPANPELPF
ncbi:MAG TPA: hypothetical protein VFT06_10360 [Flavisolibacter sp.]|nr:hypothetical protein [Flavisolibacter sp.]